MNGLKEIDPFVRMQLDSLNWTGYNSELIDTVVEKGKVLIKENADLKASKAKLEKRAAQARKNRGKEIAPENPDTQGE